MKISIVIPSFNQAAYLEETLLSVLEQGYSGVELVVIDGGSTDGSLDILRRYSRHIAYWVSEPDRGQTNAINKGLAHVAGDVWSYLNSDDLLSPGALTTIADAFRDPAVRWAGGVSETFDERGQLREVRPTPAECPRHFLTPWDRPSQYVFPCSNVTFYRRDVLAQIGQFDDSYAFCMDIEYDVRMVMRTGLAPHLVDSTLGRWRWHSNSKTTRDGLWYGFRQEEIRIAEAYLEYLPAPEQEILLRQIREQKKSVIVRRASLRRHQGRLGAAALELLRPILQYPDLLYFQPWLSTALRVALMRRGKLAR